MEGEWKMRKHSKIFKQILILAIVLSMMFTSIIGVFAEGEKTADENEPKGYVTISVEKFALGLGYIKEPVKVPFYEGDTVADITIKVIGEDYADYEDSSSYGGFWLYAVKDDETREPNWPQHILDNANVNRYGRIWNPPEWLGQYDYNEDSGWMYCVNGKFPDIIASGIEPKDGDVIRWQFTIVGLGRDIGANPDGSENADSWGKDFVPIANKDELTKLVGEINSLEEKDELLKNEDIKDAYDNGMKQLENIVSSQDDVDNALEELNRAIEKYKKIEDPKDSDVPETPEVPEEPIDSEEPIDNENPDKLIEDGTTYNWPQFMGNLELQGISDAKTPRTAEEMELKWQYTESRGEGDWVTTPGTPIIVGDYTYCYIYEKLIKFETSTGKIVRTAPAPGDAAFFINLAYGDGKIFVPRHVESRPGKEGKTYLIAYDADTLEQLFVTESIANGAQIQAQVFYHDGYIYTGPRTYNGKYAAFKTTDIDPSTPNEVVKAAWTIETDSTLGFGTNAGPAFVNGAVIFADQGKRRKEGSKVWSVDAKTGKTIDTMVLPKNEVVSSTIVYYPKNNRIYINATDNDKGAVVRSFEMNNNGAFKKDSMKAYISDVSGGGTQASPVIYNDRLYLAGGGRTMGSQEPFHVIDANTMEEIYRIDEIKTKGTPILTTAYATKENNQEVYIYLVPYAPENAGTDKEMSVMYIVRDSIGQTKPKYEKVPNVGEPQYASQSMAISPNGDMVFYNDARILYNYGNKKDHSIKGEDIVNQIDRLPDPSESPYYNNFEIRRIVERYQALSDEEKSKVTNFAKLEKILENVDPVEYLTSGINSLPELKDINLEHQGKILALKATYDRLTNEEKSKVKNIEKLLKAIEKIEKLQEEISAKGVIEAIDKLKAIAKISSADRAEILAIRARYEQLSENGKELVTNISKLEKAEKKLKEVLDQIDKADKLIRDTLIGTKITVNSKPLIDAVNKAIKGLTPEDLSTITSYEQYFIPAKIDYINALISEKLMDGDKKITVNKNNANEVEDIIKEIQTHYKSIPESELKYVENYNVVFELSKDIEKIKKMKDNSENITNNGKKQKTSTIHEQDKNEKNEMKNKGLPKTGSKEYIPIAIILILVGVFLLKYTTKR